jgi:hypothetical protein
LRLPLQAQQRAVIAVSQEDPRGAEPDHLCIDVLPANKRVTPLA